MEKRMYLGTTKWSIFFYLMMLFVVGGSANVSLGSDECSGEELEIDYNAHVYDEAFQAAFPDSRQDEFHDRSLGYLRTNRNALPFPVPDAVVDAVIHLFGESSQEQWSIETFANYLREHEEEILAFLALHCRNPTFNIDTIVRELKGMERALLPFMQRYTDNPNSSGKLIVSISGTGQRGPGTNNTMHDHLGSGEQRVGRLAWIFTYFARGAGTQIEGESGIEYEQRALLFNNFVMHRAIDEPRLGVIMQAKP